MKQDPLPPHDTNQSKLQDQNPQWGPPSQDLHLQRPLPPQSKKRISWTPFIGTISIALLVIIIGVLLAVFVLKPFAPGLPTGDRVYIQVQDINRLETVSYHLETVYKYDQNAKTPWYNIWKYVGNQKKLFVIPGEVIAGVDFSELKKGDVQVHGNAVTINLPASKILESSLDERNIQVYDISTGAAVLFQGMDPQTQDRVLADAKVSFQTDACKGNILVEAAKNAKLQLSPFLTELGFSNITVNAPVGRC